MMLGFTNFPGYYAEDEDLSELTQQCWYEIQETLMDPMFVPRASYAPTPGEIRTDPVTGQPIIPQQSGLDSIRIISKLENGSWQQQQSAMGGASQGQDPAVRERGERIFKLGTEIYQRLAEILRSKAQRPPEPTWNTWSSGLSISGL
jgi:hypothetical protein